MNLRFIRLALAAVAALFVAHMSLANAAQMAREPDPTSYCVKKGGVVQTRLPAYNTNGGDELVLAGQRQFCQFTAKDGSQINLLVTTLATRKPTLAALAYYAEVQPGNCNGNPASCYCTLLGGSDQFGGTNAAGGGWVLNTNANDVLEACIFPDMSSIDSWGLIYHSQNIIRGKNLAKILRYKNPYASSRHITGVANLPYQDNSFSHARGGYSKRPAKADAGERGGFVDAVHEAENPRAVLVT